MPTATITPPGPILSASVTLTSAQVLASFTTAVTIVPAPGAGLALVPISLILNYQFKTTAYTDNGGKLNLYWGNPAGQSTVMGVTTSGFWASSVSRFDPIVSLTLGSQNASAVANLPLSVKQDTANPTLGDGLVAVTVAYMVVPVS